MVARETIDIPDLVQRLRAIDEHEAHRWPRRVVAECQTAADALEAQAARIHNLEMAARQITARDGVYLR